MYQFEFNFVRLPTISYPSLVTINLFYGISKEANKYISNNVNCHAPEIPFATNTE